MSVLYNKHGIVYRTALHAALLAVALWILVPVLGAVTYTPGQKNVFIEVCTAQGLKKIQIDGEGPQEPATPIESIGKDCPLCAFRVTGVALTHFVPPLHAPDWTTVQADISDDAPFIMAALRFPFETRGPPRHL